MLTLDLKSDADRAKLMPLIERADILIEQFRPGVMARLGLGYDDVRAINPRLIYCSISGYGQSGPRADEAGHDINYIGNTGLLDLQPGPVAAPVVPPMLVADIAGGSFPAVINILLALRARDQSGQGCHHRHRHDRRHVHLRLVRAGARRGDRANFPSRASCGWSAARRAISSIRPRTARSSPAARSSRNSGWRSPRRSACRRNSSTTCAIRRRRATAVAKLIAARTADEWRPIFAAADCCTTIVVPLEQAMRDPHFVERGLFAHQVESASGKTMPALPLPIAPQFRDKPGAKKAPPLGKN